MASTSTFNEENLHKDKTTDDSNLKLMNSVVNSTVIIDSCDTKSLETENTIVTVSTSSDTNFGSIPNEKSRDMVRCVGKGNKGVSWSYVSEKGRGETMEDTVAIYSMSLSCNDVGGCTAPDCKYANETSPIHFFGVFDGHGGHQVSSYCANGLHEMVAEEWGREGSGDGWSRRWEVALCRAYERTDDAFKDKKLAPPSVGSTAVVVILSPCQIIAANCGDSRAVLCRGKQAFPLTVDHKPDRMDEQARITNGGGKILNYGCLRVEGVLGMTRAIGDHDLKQWVISVPEVTFTTRSEADECLILASDGLWDVMSNEDVIKFARKELRRRRKVATTEYSSTAPPAWYVSQLLLRKALDAGTNDNISIIVVDLKSPWRRHQQ